MNIAVSSLMPFRKSAERAKHQIAAADSWSRFFNPIIYIGNEVEDLLTRGGIKFFMTEDFPRTKYLVDFAASAINKADWAAIIDGDILLLPNFEKVIDKLNAFGLLAATSRRLTYNGDVSKPYRDPNDYGIGIFVARPAVWGEIAKLIPESLRVGHPLWDGWLSGAITHICGRDKFVDFSSFNCVLHPIHQERNQPHQITLTEFDNRFSHLSGLPIHKLK